MIRRTPGLLLLALASATSVQARAEEPVDCGDPETLDRAVQEDR